MAKQAWDFDQAHSSVGFTVTHMMFAKVNGSFGDWEGQLTYDPESPENSSASAVIKVESITTGNDKRDDHLRSEDFFHAEEFPEITFESTSFEGDPKDLTVTGNLTIHGHTHEIELSVEQTGTGIDPWGQKRVGFRIQGKVNREDYGLTWNQALETGGVLVGKEVKIDIEIQAVAQSEEEEASA